MNGNIPQNHRQNDGKRNGERGQAFTELAISLLFLLILLSVVVELGWTFYTMSALRDAAQEAASYGAMCPFTSDDTTANVTMIRERLVRSASAPIDLRDIQSSDIEIWFTGPATAAHNNVSQLPVVTTPVMGGNIVVRATLNHKILMPFAGAFIGTQEFPLTVQIADTVMRSKWLKQCDYH